jgi:hypothetical protein
MHYGARVELVSALSKLVVPTTDPIERVRGIALGMILAAKCRGELSEGATDALCEYVLTSQPVHHKPMINLTKEDHSTGNPESLRVVPHFAREP